MLVAKDMGSLPDHEAFDARVRAAVAEVVPETGRGWCGCYQRR